MPYQFIYVYIINVYIYICYAGLSFPSHNRVHSRHCGTSLSVVLAPEPRGEVHPPSYGIYMDLLWENHGKPSIQLMEELYPTDVGKPMV